MIEIISKDPPKEMYKQAVCKRCGWTYGYVPFRDAIKAVNTDYGGGQVSWYYIPCLNELCHDTNFFDSKSRVEVERPT